MKGKKSKKSVTESATKVKSRAKCRCPKELEPFIALANSIPPERNLPHPDDIFPPNPEGQDLPRRRKIYYLKIKELLEGVPDDFFAYLPRRDEIQYQILKYQDFRDIRMTLREFAELVQMPEQKRKYFTDPGYTFVGKNEFLDEPNDSYSDVGPRDERYRLPAARCGWNAEGKFMISPLAKIFEELDMDQSDKNLRDRLKKCGVCEQIFWAKQYNMVACDPRCSTTNRQRRLREKRAQYEEARKKKRRSAKAKDKRK
jgi:hypothetical protein